MWCDICKRYIEWDGHTGELHYKALLKEAHDKMDDYNAGNNIGLHNPASKQDPYCIWCAGWPPSITGYDGNGLRHTEDCILVRIRKVL